MSHSMRWTSDTHLLALILDDVLCFCSFLSSHPLHLVYFLFFSPYLLQLFSFLSPLLLSTSLLLLALLTVSQHLNDPPPPSSELLGNACAAILDILKAKLEADATFSLIEEYSSMVLAIAHGDAAPSFQEPAALAFPGDRSETEFEATGEASSEYQYSSMVLAIAHGDAAPSFQEPAALAFPGDGSETEFEATGEASSEYLSIASEAGESPTELALENAKEVELLVPSFGDQETDDLTANASKASEVGSEKPSGVSESPVDNAGESLGKSAFRHRRGHARSASERLRRDGSIRDEGASKSLESLSREGSMRREKEWKRTLACKLYEERMTFKLCEERTVVEGCEEMDLLWEAYEADAIKSDKPSQGKGKKKEKKEERKEEEEYEEETGGELCCLHALRLSAGKMNLGVGRPNLLKFSRALKGMGLLQRVASRRSRKG